MESVYLLKEEENNYFKIGVSKDVKQRIKQLQTGSASHITLYKEYSSEYAHKIEKALHRRYKHYRVSGEWFNLPIDAVEDFLNECETFDNNFKVIDKSRDPNHLEFQRRTGNF